jgi:hypothetical protein
MPELKPLVDFPATVVRLKTMADFSIRAEFSMPETAADEMKTLHNIRERYLRVVIYDDDEFQEALIASRKQE